MTTSTSSEQTEQAQPWPRRRRRWLRVTGLLCLVLIVIGAVCWYTPPLRDRLVRAALSLRDSLLAETGTVDAGQQKQNQQALDAKAAESPAARPTDEDHRRRMLGDWHQTRDDAERDLTLRADGTGTMIVLPTGTAGQWYLGERIECDIQWTVENGRALFESVSGRPPDKFSRLIGLFGRDRNRQIIELTEERILMYDETQDESHKFSEWQRVRAEAAGSSP